MIMVPWQIQGPSSSFPCASVSSFGFGGTNGHVVLAATAFRAEKKGPRRFVHLSRDGNRRSERYSCQLLLSTIINSTDIIKYCYNPLVSTQPIGIHEYQLNRLLGLFIGSKSLCPCCFRNQKVGPNDSKKVNVNQTAA